MQELVDDMKAAWEAEKARFEAVANLVLSTAESTLEEHGLTGAALRFKLSVVAFLHKKFLENGKNFLSRLVKAIDDLLSSALAAAQINGAIIEIKDAIMNSVKD